MAPTKATIAVEEDSTVITAGGYDNPFTVDFNPTEYTLNKAAKFAEIAIPGMDSPILQYIGGQNEKLTMDLFFDTTLDNGFGAGAKDVRDLTEKVYRLVKINPVTHAVPKVKFSWGADRKQGLFFKAVVESVQQKFTLFSPDGVPVRATLSVTFREYRTLEEQLRELKYETADHQKRHVVTQGETLSSIARKEYEDPSKWTLIAQANADRLPSLRRLEPGTLLDLPPDEFLDEDSRT